MARERGRFLNKHLQHPANPARRTLNNPYVKERPYPPPKQLSLSRRDFEQNPGNFVNLMTGHSFVRGYKYAVLKGWVSPDIQGTPSGMTFQDVTQQLENDHGTASLLSRKVGVAKTYGQFYTHARNMTFIADLARDYTLHIEPYQAHTMLIHMGTNDLATLRPIPGVLGFSVSEVIAMAVQLRDFVQFTVPNSVKVICMGVVPRLAGLLISPQQFLAAARIFNDQLQKFHNRAIAGTEPTHFRYYEMSGWDQTQIDNHQVDLDPMEWCNDRGIHPRHHVYLDKYTKSVKNALMRNRPFEQK